jgi:ribonuclease R
MDPYYEKELEKYDNPIPSRDYILELLANNSLTKEQLYDLLKIDDNQKKTFKKRLMAMTRDKQISCNKKGSYRKFSKLNLLSGKVIAHPKGFGFVELDKEGKDLRLSSKQMKLVFHGDKIKVQLLNQQRDAQIIEITKKVKTLAGRLYINKEKAYVVVDDKRIKNNIKITNLSKKHKNNQMVIVKITKYPTLEKLATGEIIKVLGNYMDKGVEIDSILCNYDIPTNFSKETIEQTLNIDEKISPNDKKNRVDLTKIKLITIDGEDSRDFDDAVYAKKTNNGWNLIVAIADVAHYVKENSSIDKDAFKRGNSVYFHNHVVPMLPEKLSNNLCSIVPKSNRLCIACDINIDKDGNLLNYKFYEAIMSSYARLTYDEVHQILEDKNPVLIKKYKDVTDNLNTLYQLYKALKSSSIKRGVIDFNRIETKILFNDDGKIKNIVQYHNTKAHKIIEECMLIANQASAEFLANNNKKILYRVHPQPSAEKIEFTRKFLKMFDLNLTQGKISSKKFAQILNKAKNTNYENIITTVILRAMEQATYTTNNQGHFGLTLDYYTHFTSPIRRYPDLLIHRTIKNILHKKQKKDNKEDMAFYGKHLSMTERRAENASRDAEKWLKCEYMLDKIDKTFNGSISGVANFGLFVELKGIFLEGLIKISDIKDDYYVFDAANHQLKGDRKGYIYRLGDNVNVKVSSVNIDDREILFTLNK